MNVKELRIRQSITGLIAKTNPTLVPSFNCRNPYVALVSLTAISLFPYNTKQYYRMYISLLVLPLQRVLPNDRSITCHRPVHDFCSL